MTDAVEEFLARSPADVQAISRALRALVKRTMPQAHEILVARHNHCGYSTSESVRDRIVYICPMKDYVRFGFDYGGQLDDPEQLLEGEGKRMRHIKVRTLPEANRSALKRLVKGAWTEAKTRMQNKSARPT